MPSKKSYIEFAADIKKKYPAYKDIDDLQLTKDIVAKYPAYSEIVSFEQEKFDTSDLSLRNTRVDLSGSKLNQQPLTIQPLVGGGGKQNYFDNTQPKGIKKTIQANQQQYLANPQHQAVAQFDNIQAQPSKYVTPNAPDENGNPSAYDLSDDKEYMDNLFAAMPAQKQFQEWQKNKERWNEHEAVQQFKTVNDDQKGFAKIAPVNWVEAISAGADAVMGGLSEFMYQNIEKPLYGWMWKDPNSRQIWGRLSDHFNAGQQYLSSAAGKENTVDNTGQIRQKDFVDYFKEGDWWSAMDDITTGALESAPTSAVAIGATMAGSPQAGLALIGAQVAGSRKRELDRYNPELSEWQKNLIAFGSGAIEAGSGILGDVPIGKMLSNLYRRGGTVVFDNVMKNSVDDIIRTTTKNLRNGSLLWKAPLGEGSEEIVSGVGNYLLDTAVGIQNFNFSNMMTDAAKQGVYGAVSSSGFGFMGTPGIARNQKVAKVLQTLKSDYDQKKSELDQSLNGSGFEFNGEKIITLPLDQQEQVLTSVLSASNLTDKQKASITGYMQAGNRLNAALVNTGLTNIELLRKKAAAVKEVSEQVNDKTGTVDAITIQGTADSEVYQLRSGHIATDEAGEVNTRKSDESVYYYTGNRNEDGTKEVKIIPSLHVSKIERQPPQVVLTQKFTEIEQEEFGRSEFGEGMIVRLTDEQGNTPIMPDGSPLTGIINAVTEVGFVVEMPDGSESEIPFRVAAQTMEKIETSQPEAGENAAPTAPAEYQPGATAQINGQTYVIRDKDEQGNYNITDSNGQLIDRFTPEEMAGMGFEAISQVAEPTTLQPGTIAELEDGTTSVITSVNPDGSYDVETQHPDGAVSQRTVSTSELPGLGFTTSSPVAEEPVAAELTPEQQAEQEKQQFIATLPKVEKGNKAGRVDTKKLTPEQAFQYTKIIEGTETAVKDIKDDIFSIDTHIRELNKKLQTTQGTAKIDIREDIRELNEQRAGLKTILDREAPGLEAEMKAQADKKAQIEAEVKAKNEAIAEAQKNRVLTDAEKEGLHNNIVSLLKEHNEIPPSHTQKRRAIFNEINKKASQLGYAVNVMPGGQFIVKDKEGKEIRTIAKKTSQEELDIHPLLTEYKPEFQAFALQLMQSMPETLDFPNTNVEKAVKDILAGSKTVAANRMLDGMNEMYANNEVVIRATASTPEVVLSIEDYFELFEPTTEEEQQTLDTVPYEILNELLGDGEMTDEISNYLNDLYNETYNQINGRTEAGSPTESADRTPEESVSGQAEEHVSPADNGTEKQSEPRKSEVTPTYSNGDTVTYKGKQYEVNGIGKYEAGNVIYDLEQNGKTVYEDVAESELGGEAVSDRETERQGDNETDKDQPRPTEEIISLLDELAGKSSNAGKFITNLHKGMLGLTIDEVSPIIGLSPDNESNVNVKLASDYYTEARKRYKTLQAERKQEADELRANDNVDVIEKLAIEAEAEKQRQIAEQPSPTQKQPWEMTREEYRQKNITDLENWGTEKDVIHSTTSGNWYAERPNNGGQTRTSKTKKVLLESIIPFERETSIKYINNGNIDWMHEASVQKALSEGKTITENVLADYPELKKEEVKPEVKNEIPVLTEEQSAMTKQARKSPSSVRELADMDAEDNNGYLSAGVLTTVEQGQSFKVGQRNYTVTRKSKPSQVQYENEKFKGEYTRTSVTIKDDKGKTYSFEMWDDWTQNGKRMVSTILRKGSSRSNDPVAGLSRDIEGDITIDLINEYNQFHDKSDSYKILNKYILDVNRKLGTSPIQPTPTQPTKQPTLSREPKEVLQERKRLATEEKNRLTKLLSGKAIDMFREQSENELEAGTFDATQTNNRISELRAIEKELDAQIKLAEQSEKQGVEEAQGQQEVSFEEEKPVEPKSIEDIAKEAVKKNEQSKVSQAQQEADEALNDFLDAFNDLQSDNLGIIDNTAERQAKMLVAGTKMIGAYTKLGLYKFADILYQLEQKGIQITEDLLSAIKKAYGAFAAENDIDDLDDMKTVRKFTLNDLSENKNEDLTQKQDNEPKKEVSLTAQNTAKDNGSNKPNSGTADSKPEPNRTGLSLFDEVDGQRTPTENIAGNSKGEQLQSGNSSSESGNRPKYDVNKTHTNEEISEIVSSVTTLKNGKIEITGEVTDDIKTIASRYVSGGVAKQGRGILDEYYTDSKIVDAVTLIVTKLIPSNTVKRALEPSVGTGNFIQAIPTSAEIVGFEINETTARIAKIFNPTVEVNLRSFETEFIDDSGKKKPITRKYNLVVGNPPYGEHRGIYKGLGEESKISKYEDYFVKRSLDVLEEGGILAMVLPSSWMERHKTESGYTIEAAYRLPSGAFEATQVGTDIVVLRKNAAHTSSEPHNYFQNNPENVLGEIKERSNRFGKMEQYVAGDIDAALSKIKQNEARKVANVLQVEETADNINDIAESIEETGSPDKTKKLVKASKPSQTATVTTGKVDIKKGTLKYKLNKGDEVVPTSSQFPNEFTPEQEAAFKDCDYAGIIPKSKYEQHKQFVNFYNFNWVHDFYYAEGNIYEKLEQLERDKPNMEQAQYDKQKQMLRSVLPEIKTLDKVRISPNTEFVGKLNISNENGRINLKVYFEAFILKLPRESFGGSNSWEVRDYINNRQVYGSDKERNALVRERRKAAANDLFKKFLTDEVSAAERSQIEYAFNREYNAMYRPDYSKVPMFSSINKNFKGRPLQLTIVQRAGIGRSTVKGVGILAHEVGFGKTLSGILSVHEAMTRGTSKKPLIVVPNDSILKQWVETIHEVLPQSTVNVLGNLGVDYDLTDFSVNDNEITLVTYEGFKAMGFKDETYDNLARNFNYITDDLNAHKSERDKQKEKAKKDETKGKMRKKVAYNFEDFGFDFMTFDEVHNANHIVGKVKLDKSVASDFRSQSQRTSDLGIKTWLASQYIQENNNGRNVLLLSATPFTNKPLEYYSILSLVANSTLERMGFYKVDQFFETFMEADNDIEIKADGTPAQKTNIRRFKNNGLFNQLLSEFIDIKGEDDNPDLVRPERYNREYKIPQNDLTAYTISNIQDLFMNNEDVLKGITHSRLAAFSPYATIYSYATPKNYKQFVENSPKTHTALKLIAQNKKDNSGAGQLMYSEIGVEFFPMIQEYLIKEVGYNANEVKIISGATSLTERANIQNGFNKGEIKVIIGSPAIKEGINLQENTTDMYILSLPYNFTQLRQVEGRSWRQGNKWSNIRINYMLTDNSVDVFLLQRLQIKQGLYNESMKNGADTVDVSDIDTSELKTALITDPTTRANIELMIERGRLEAEKTRITSDLAFVHRKYEKYNEFKKKINDKLKELQQIQKRAETDDWWKRYLESEKLRLLPLETELENEKQRLVEKGVNVDDIVSQETSATNQIAEIDKKIEALKERLIELIEKYTAENIAKAKTEGDIVSRYIKERAQENKGDFYTKRIVDESTQLHTGTTMKTTTPEEVAATVEQLLKTWLAKEVRMITPEEIAGILEGNEQLHAVYHGSPHSFDQFSLDYIGTGEGAQAYGWGLYFTDKKEIAEGYAKMAQNDILINGIKLYDIEEIEPLLANYDFTMDVKTPKGLIEYAKREKENIELSIKDAERDIDNVNALSERKARIAEGQLKETEDILSMQEKTYSNIQNLKITDAQRSNLEKYFKTEIGILNNKIEQLRAETDPKYHVKYIMAKALDSISYDKELLESVNYILDNEKNVSISKQRNLYAVELHEGKQPGEYDYLRWDDRVTAKQQEVIKIIYDNITNAETDHKKASVLSREFEQLDFDNLTGEDVYKRLSELLGSDKNASLELLKWGIDGIQYPANFTTGKANETDFNYVVFDPSAITIKEKVQFMRTPTGTIYGFVKNGIVYINSNTPNLNTPIHEFGHLWIDNIEVNHKALFEKGAELIKETIYWERVNADPNYSHLSENARLKEAMAMAIGDKGEKTVKNLGLFARLKSWIYDVWKAIGAQFGIQNLRPEQIEKLTFKQFTDIAVSELLSGENLVQDKLNAPLNRLTDTEYIAYESYGKEEALPITEALNKYDIPITGKVWQETAETVTPVHTVYNSENLPYALYRIAPNYFDILKRRRNLLKFNSSDKVPEINKPNAELFSRIFNSTIEDYVSMLQRLKYLSTPAAQNIINDIISEAAYAKDYYERYAQGEDVWRTEKEPHYQVVNSNKKANFEAANGSISDLRQFAEKFDNARTDDEKYAASMELAEALNTTWGKTYDDYAYSIIQSGEAMRALLENQFGTGISEEQKAETAAGMGAYFNGRAYFIVNNISNSENFIRTWAHENGHRETGRNFSEGFLEGIYDALDAERSGQVEDLLHDSYVSQSKAEKVNELLSYTLEDMFIHAAMQGHSLTSTQIDRIISTDNLDFKGALSTLYNNLIKQQDNGQQRGKDRNDGRLHLSKGQRMGRGDTRTISGNRDTTGPDQRDSEAEAGSWRGVQPLNDNNGGEEGGNVTPRFTGDLTAYAAETNRNNITIQRRAADENLASNLRNARRQLFNAEWELDQLNKSEAAGTIKKDAYEKKQTDIHAVITRLKSEVAGYEKQVQAEQQAEPKDAAKYKVTPPSLPAPPVLTSDMSIQQAAEAVTNFKQQTGEVFQDVNKEMEKISDIYTAFVDRARPLEKILQLMVEKGAVLTDGTNAYMNYSTSASRATYLIQEYEKTRIKPLQDLLKKVNRSGKLNSLPAYVWNVVDENTGEIINDKAISNYDRISLYLQAKDIVEADSMEDIANRGAEGFKNNVHDPNGQEISPEDYISKFEAAVGPKTINEIWDKVRSINKWALDLQLEHGIITREVYDKYTDGTRKYYVPQRGWRERDLNDSKLYYVTDKSDTPDNPFNAALVKARGRKTLAGDPLAYMQSIGESSVMAALKNDTKQVFLNFAETNADFARNHKFFEFKKVFYVNTGERDADGNVIYERTYEPPTKEQLDADKELQKKIAEVVQAKEVVAENHDTGKISDAAYAKAIALLNAKEKKLTESIQVKFAGSEATAIRQVTSKERKQHTVVILRAGKEYEIQFTQEYDGERVSNVLNRNFGNDSETDLKLMQKAAEALNTGTRFMSAMMTQYNPTFALTNAVRDYGIASISNIAEFGIAYNLQFNINLVAVQRTVWQYAANDQFKGKSENEFSNGKYGKLLQEFFEDGAATGWSFLKSVNQLRETMQSAIDPQLMKDVVYGGKFGAVNFFGLKQSFGMLTEVSELTTRFAEYVTSREMKNADGSFKYSRQQSAIHAKEVTVNFDRKGNVKFFSTLFSFFNASVQGTNKLFRMIRDPRVRRMMIATSSTLLVGGLLQALLMPDPDDDDERLFTEWEMMNNLCIGKLKLPLPQGLRAFWGIGVQAGLAARGTKGIAQSVTDGTKYFFGELVPEQLSFWLNGLEIDEQTNTLTYNPTLAMRGIVPTTAQPLYDLWQNTNFMGGTSYRTEFTNSMQGTKAERTLGKKNVSDAAQTLSDWLWVLGGGDVKDSSRLKKGSAKVVSGPFDINPSAIETLVRGYSAGTGKFAMDMVGLAQQVFDPEKEVDISTIQMANAFWKQPREYNVLQSKMWELDKKAEFYKSQYNDIKKNNPERYQQIIQFHQDNAQLRQDNPQGFKNQLEKWGTAENRMFDLIYDARVLSQQVEAKAIDPDQARQQAEVLLVKIKELQ